MFHLKLDIAISICEALNELQKNKICYGDLKPENILIKYKKENLLDLEEVILYDFEDIHFLKNGLEKPTLENHRSDRTKRWCSPEISEFKKISIFSDVWSFGNILLFIFSGKPPYWDLKDDQIHSIIS
jgi:serine/threonine protein kinase